MTTEKTAYEPLRSIFCLLIAFLTVFTAGAFSDKNAFTAMTDLHASAELEGNTFEYSGCTFSYEFINYYGAEEDDEADGGYMLQLTGVQTDGQVIDIPESVVINGTEYAIGELGTGFAHDTEVNSIIIPDSVKVIADDFAKDSSVETLTISKNAEKIGSGFCSGCMNISTVNYSGSAIKELGQNAFVNSEYSGYGYNANSMGAVTLGNWLIRYTGDEEELRICALGENVDIDSMADHSLYSNRALRRLDMEGVKHIGAGAVQNCSELEDIVNGDDVEFVGEDAFIGTKWYGDMCETKVVTLGKALIRYITDDNVIDLTEDRFSGIGFVTKYAFEDCRNADTFKVNSDVRIADQCFHMREGYDYYDKVPAEPHCMIRNVYLDGEKIEYSSETPCMPKWIHDNYAAFLFTAFELENAEAKTKDIFKQMDIEYYGPGNDKMGTHTPTEEFYINLKIHNYIAVFPVSDACGDLDSFLTGFGYSCMGYSGLTEYLLECAGVRAGRLNETTHAWTCTQIGGEWYQTDAGWDEQMGCTYTWSFLSAEAMAKKDPSHHVAQYVTSIHRSNYGNSTEPPEFGRTIGDVNGDNMRGYADVELMWSYIRGEDAELDEKLADIDRDGKVDITDAVLVDRFVKGKSIDRSLLGDDRMAPGFWVALVNGNDYDDIVYMMTEADGSFVLPDNVFEHTQGRTLLGWDIGDIGGSVRITKPYTVISAVWDELPDDDDNGEYILGDVNHDGVIDIADAVMILSHVNGIKALNKGETKRGDVTLDNRIAIDDAVLIINYINGHKDF